MFWFLLLGLLLVIGGVTLAVVRSGVGEGDGRVSGGLADPVPERLAPVLPPERPLVRADVDALRLPLGLRGYRMEEVDDVLDRLGAELSERDARIAELEASLAGDQAAALGRPDLFTKAGAQTVSRDESLGAKLAHTEASDHDELAGWDSGPTGAERSGGATRVTDQPQEARPRTTEAIGTDEADGVDGVGGAR